MSESTLPAFQRSVGNQEVMRMLEISRQAAAPAPAQPRQRPAAFDQQRAVAYNRERFTFDQSLVDQLNQVAGDRELYEAVTASRQVGPEFAQLVYAAQQVLFPGAANDGMLGPGTLRTVRQRTGHASTEVGLAANGRPIPERQVRTASPNDPASERTFTTERTGGFIVTGGYMEASGHATKRGISAIMSNDPDNITALPDSGRNLGIDYVVQNRGKDVNAWYGGLVTHAGLDGGYGYRVIVETDVTYLFNGKEYTVFQGYGHNSALHIRKGSVIEPGARIATMGGTGSGGAVRYAEHVDLRTWIMVDGKKVDVSPNLLDQQIASRRQGAGPQAATRQPGSGQTTNGQTRANAQAQTNQQPANQGGNRQQPQGDGGGGGLIEEQMAFTSPFEGGRQPRVYTDTEGHPTVGIGFNLDRSDARRRLTDVGANYDNVRAGTETLSNQQMDTLFRQDVEHFTAAARGIVSNFDSLPRTAQLIIVDMTFNLGSDGFAKFRKAIAAFERNDFETAAAEMQDSTWYGQVGRRSRHHVAAIRALATAPQGQTAAPQPGNAVPAAGGTAPTRARVAERPAAHPRPAVPATTPAGNPIGTATVTADVLNVRQGPSQTAPRVGRLQRAQVVQVLARQGEWLQIRYGSSTAFIHGEHATFRPRAQQPGQQTGSGRDTSGINVSFGPNADASVVSQYTLQVLKECLAVAGERNATITSTSRTPRDQARAMYNNIVSRGVASQRALYAAAGDQVIDAYVASKEAGNDRDGILADMTAAIQRIRPGRVSKHCADPAVLGVIDVGPSSVENKERFVAAVEADPRVSNFLHPGNSSDPAYHIEIPQR